MYPLRAPAEELDAWRDAAAEAGETLAGWLREAARRRLESLGARRLEPTFVGDLLCTDCEARIADAVKDAPSFKPRLRKRKTKANR